LVLNAYVETNTVITVSDPGTTYTLMKSGWGYLPYLAGKKGKLILAYYYGNEVGSGKGIRVQNVTDGATLAEVTWNGSSNQNHFESAEFTFPAAGKMLQVQCKGSSATEDIVVGNVYIVIY